MLEQPVLEHHESSSVPRLGNTQTLTVSGVSRWSRLLKPGNCQVTVKIYVSYLNVELGCLSFPM
jgi:hypothetical protein